MATPFSAGTSKSAAFWHLWAWHLVTAATHMISMTIVIPGLYQYIKTMDMGDITTLGWAFAAYPLGTMITVSFLKSMPLPPIRRMTMSREDTDKQIPQRQEENEAEGIMQYEPQTYQKFHICFYMLVGVGAAVLYSLSPHAISLIAARLFMGMAGGSMMITHKFVEFSTSGDDKMVRPRMVILGAVQALGAVCGLLLGVSLSAVPSVNINGGGMSQQQLCGFFVAFLYGLCFLGMYCNFEPIDEAVVKHIDVSKGEMDVCPGNYMGFSRFGCLPQALIYDRGQARPSSLPDVFSTAVVLVLTFFTNNLMTAVEVVHAAFCVDEFKWNVTDISVTYLAFIMAGIIGICLTLSLIEEVPCNRRLFGGLVLCFVTYGVMLQPATPKEQYIGFLVLVGCCYTICDLAMVEIYIDKVGEENDPRMTASSKKSLMQMFHSGQAGARIVGSICSGYIYNYYSEKNHLDRRPYAIYGCGFAVALLLVIMTVIFYKRFVLRSAELQPGYVAKESLAPQQIDCYTVTGN
jgi:MFS family permease